MKTDSGAHSYPAHQSQLMTVLRRLRVGASCANELERGHLLWRPGQEPDVHAADLHLW